MFGKGFASAALGVAALCAAAPACAQVSANLTLICPGEDSRIAVMRTSRGGMKMPTMKRTGRMGDMTSPAPTREQKLKAQMNVIVEGVAARIWVSEGLLPSMTRRSADGWYALSDVEIDAAGIRGKAPFGELMGRATLRIDRTTGKASLGAFQGVCHPAMLGPEVTRF